MKHFLEIAEEMLYKTHYTAYPSARALSEKSTLAEMHEI
jgi:hypothetical protein